MLSILDTKKVRKLLHLSVVKDCEMLSLGLRRLLMVVNNVRGFEEPE